MVYLYYILFCFFAFFKSASIVRPKSKSRSKNLQVKAPRSSDRITKLNSNMSIFHENEDVFDTDSSASSENFQKLLSSPVRKCNSKLKAVPVVKQEKDQDQVPKVGSLIDLMDNNGTYNVASIKSVKTVKGETILGCHYIGWETSYDADCRRMKFPNSRIAPLHTITRTYKAFAQAGIGSLSITWPVQVYFRQPREGYKGGDFHVFSFVWVMPYGKPDNGMFDIQRDQGMWVKPNVLLGWDIGIRESATNTDNFKQSITLAQDDVDTAPLPISDPCEEGTSMLKKELLDSCYVWPGKNVSERVTIIRLKKNKCKATPKSIPKKSNMTRVRAQCDSRGSIKPDHTHSKSKLQTRELMNELEQEKGMLEMVLSLYSVSKFIKDFKNFI